MVDKSDVKCFDTFVKTMKKLQTDIVNYFNGRYSSGFVEGINNKVKTLKRRCYGIFSEETLFIRLFLDMVGYAEYGLNKGVSST